MKTKTPEATAAQTAADELAATWILVATNEGTYSAIEACRAIGTGDPAFANCAIYERVGDGARRVDGPDPDRAPGYLRRFNGALADAQRELKRLRKAARS